MSKPNHPSIPCGQTAMFSYQTDATAKALALDATRWVYPCGLCNGQMVSEPGRLCSTCAPTPPRSRRRTTTKKTRTSPATRKGAA